MAKDESIETLRAIAIILVIGFHLVNDAQMEPAKDLYQYIAYTFQHIRIPLFTVISGYLYGFRPVRYGHYRSFFFGKVRRILIPLFAVVTLQFVATSVLPGVSNPTAIEDIWRVWLFPYEHFWFLQVIFLVFLFVGFLDRLQLLQSFRLWVIVFSASIVLQVVYPRTGLNIQLFSAGATSYLLPYFLLGYGIARFYQNLIAGKMLIVWLAVFLPSVFLQQLLWFYEMPEAASKMTVLGVSISVSGCTLLFKLRFPVWGLKTIGAYAYTIYLYQGFGTALGRRISSLFPDINEHIYFASVIAIAVAFGMFLEIVVSRLRGVRTVLLGLK